MGERETYCGSFGALIRGAQKSGVGGWREDLSF